MVGQSFLNDVNRQFDAAARFVPMQDGLAEKIRVCNATYVTRFGVRLRGRMETFVGWRAVHSTHVTPAKGVFAIRQMLTRKRSRRSLH